MSEQNPYQKLGVTENASFEEIQAAKQRLLKQHGDDSQTIETVEAAYDAIIMDRLRMRQEGKIKVPEGIRYPEREKPPEPALNLNQFAVKNSPSWLQGLIDTPSRNDIFVSAAIFVALMGITVFTSATQVSLWLTLGIFANVYFFYRKGSKFWRSLLITLGALCLGLTLGAGLASLMAESLTLDVQQLYALVSFCFLWLSSNFLR